MPRSRRRRRRRLLSSDDEKEIHVAEPRTDTQRISNFSVSKSFGCSPDAARSHPQRSDLRRHSANSSRRPGGKSVARRRPRMVARSFSHFRSPGTVQPDSPGPWAPFPFKTIITCEKFARYGSLAQRNRNCPRSWPKVICTNFSG